MVCSDSQALQQFLDGDLDEVRAELLSHHLESCADCRLATQDAAATRSFVQDHLGIEDEGEDTHARATLARIAKRLDERTSGTHGWWRRTLIAAAVIAAFMLALPLPFSSNLSASKIIEEAADRERSWLYQPNKTLHWEVDAVAHGVKGLPDGSWRTLFWQKNGADSLIQISRQFDPEGNTDHAWWQRPDGSVISYRGKQNVLEISPSTQNAEEILPTLAPELRSALDSYLAARKASRSLIVQLRRDSARFHRPYEGNGGGQTTFSRSFLRPWGEVYHLVVDIRHPVNPRIIHAVHEYEIQRSSYRLLRLKTTLRYSDGTIGTHDAHWVAYGEINSSEFDAQTPGDLMRMGTPVVRLTPVDIAQRWLHDSRGSSQN